MKIYFLTVATRFGKRTVRVQTSYSVIPAGQPAEFAEQALEPLALGIRERAVFRSAFELEGDEQIEFAGGERSAFDRPAEKVPQKRGTLKRVSGEFRSVRFARIVGPRRFERGLGFPRGPFEGGAPYLPRNGECDVTVAFPEARGSERGEERAERLLRGVFAGEGGIALAHAAKSRVQHGEKQKHEDAVGETAGKGSPRFEKFREQRVGRGVAGERLQVQKEFSGTGKGREMRTGA